MVKKNAFCPVKMRQCHAKPSEDCYNVFVAGVTNTSIKKSLLLESPIPSEKNACEKNVESTCKRNYGLELTI